MRLHFVFIPRVSVLAAIFTLATFAVPAFAQDGFEDLFPDPDSKSIVNQLADPSDLPSTDSEPAKNDVPNPPETNSSAGSWTGGKRNPAHSAAQRLEELDDVLTAPSGSLPMPENPSVGVNPGSLALLSIEMTEPLVMKSPTVPAVVRLVLLTEKFLNQRCLGVLYQTLQYSGPPTDPKCVEYMEKVLQWQPSNPVALCVRDGIDSESCRTAYERQQVEQGDPWSQNAAIAGLPSGLGERLQAGYSAAATEQMGKLKDDFATNNRQFNELTDPEAKRVSLRTLRRVGEQWLRLACELTGTRFERTFASDPEKESQKYLDELRNALSKLSFKTQEDQILEIRKRVESDFKGKTTTRSKELLARARKILSNRDNPDLNYGDVMRIRIVTDRCRDAATTLQTVDPNSPSALCGTEGAYTPRCIDAIRQRRLDAEQERLVRVQYLQQKRLAEIQQQVAAREAARSKTPLLGPDGVPITPSAGEVDKGFKTF